MTTVQIMTIIYLYLHYDVNMCRIITYQAICEEKQIDFPLSKGINHLSRCVFLHVNDFRVYSEGSPSSASAYTYLIQQGY